MLLNLRLLDAGIDPADSMAAAKHPAKIREAGARHPAGQEDGIHAVSMNGQFYAVKAIWIHPV